jgi:hypothetical protein
MAGYYLTSGMGKLLKQVLTIRKPFPMPKRFTDTDKWKKPWFRSLSPVNKCFWQYIVDNCDHAGVWDVDFELAELFIKAELNEEEIRSTFKKQFLELKEGRKWFIQDFIEFQYGELNPLNRAHNSVITILQKEGAYKGLNRAIQGRKDKDKDKDKDKETKGLNVSDKFFLFWKEYPKKVAKPDALKAWNKLDIDNGTFDKIMLSLEKQKNSKDWLKDDGQYIPHPASWLNKHRWEDEVKEVDDWKG